jgi:hypothetical protein
MEQERPVSIHVLLLLLLCIMKGAAIAGAGKDDYLRAGFQNPPPRARPDAFWPWLNGHADPDRITEEMEAFQAAGFSRLQVWDVLALENPEGIVPTGPAFLSDAWLENLAHAEREATRLGLELGLVAASGWNAGGTWVTPEHAGLGLYSSMHSVLGPAMLDMNLTFPEFPAHSPRGEDGRPAYWQTVAVQASPAGDSGVLAPERARTVSRSTSSMRTTAAPTSRTCSGGWSPRLARSEIPPCDTLRSTASSSRAIALARGRRGSWRPSRRATATTRGPGSLCSWTRAAPAIVASVSSTTGRAMSAT